MIERFSDRHGFRPSAKISIYEDAPDGLRKAIPLIADSVRLSATDMRQSICEVLLEPPDPNNWSDLNIRREVDCLMATAPWHKVYDIAEALYDTVANGFLWPHNQYADQFENSLNDFFLENGIGWELRNGKIYHRGSEAFEKGTHEVPDRLDGSGFPAAATEMREALKDISRRPEPDITGAIQHAMAALEATAREVTNQPKPTLGKLVTELDLPAPLDQAVSKLWGFASSHGRHIREGQTFDRAEAELIVSIAGALCAFIVQR